MASPEALRLDSITIAEIRNIRQARLQLAPRLNLVSGNNGHGKTSLLEAVYLLTTSRSFRTARLGELVGHGATVASVRGQFREAEATTREQSVGVQGGRRTVRLDGEAPPSLAHYATRSPVVVFDPQQLRLSTGPSAERRQLLDRLTLYERPAVATDRARYTRALAERQRLLTDRAASDAALSAYEALLAEHGAALTEARQAASEALGAHLVTAFQRIAAPDLRLEARYQPAGSPDRADALERLRAQRGRDARSRRTSFGPHRDDLELRIDGRSARVVGSQGQHRAITLALKIAEMHTIAAARGLRPILLLDDVSSELDAERTAALFAHLAEIACQIFLTTTRPGLIEAPDVPPAERLELSVVHGVLAPVS